ncbi:hypothetical protein HPB48_026496 [Haemaphysalis longicornis]|uniref:Endonuclease/exonuclease/phosphatase domain-containing protein n=1 Tax=Haemaphysalis longicornis TaxID=44386 RepID=A0A9J6HC96_HAELO|nr:hypothetical protein HPB48_026496 [Haemaphysalis longicornis]
MPRQRTIKPETEPFTIWQWNCQSFGNKKAALQQHIRSSTKKPDIIMLQETVVQYLKLTGYRAHANTNGQRGVCTFLQKGLTAIESKLSKKTKCELVCIESAPGKRFKWGLYITNVYSNPKGYCQKFKNILRATNILAREAAPIVVGGDFKAPHQAWGYSRDTAKDRDLMREATEPG